jgi:hypothetical protein
LANFWGGNKKVSQKPKSKLSKTKTNSHEPNVKEEQTTTN